MTAPNNYPPQHQPPAKLASRWYHSWAVILPSLLFNFPVGLIVLLIRPRASTMVKLVFAGFFGLVFIRVLAKHDKSTPSKAEIAAAAEPPTVEAHTPATAVAPTPSALSVAVLWVKGSERQLCYQLSAASIERALVKQKGSMDAVKAETLKKMTTTANKKDDHWTVVDGCPTDSVLATCVDDNATSTAYELGFAEASKGACKGQFTTTPAYDIAVANRPTKVSAGALFAAYQANEVSADNKYKDRKLLVTGTVSEISKSAFGSPILSLATSNEFMSILCNGNCQRA
jgi:hypothetical protein